MTKRIKYFDRRGFTSLDLLMVIVIMAVLTLVALPRYFQAHERSHVAAAEMDLTQLRNALALYAADHDVYPQSLNSMEDMHEIIVDNRGNEYMTLPSGDTFDWVSYQLDPLFGYVLRIKAHDHSETILKATAEGVGLEG